MADDFMQGAQIGLGIAQQWAARSARQQEMRVQEAYRRMQERQLAAQAEHLAAQTEQLRQSMNQALQQQADFQKAEAGYRIDTDPENPVGAMAPGEALLKNYVPVLGRYHPQSVPSLILDAAGTRFAPSNTEKLFVLEKRLRDSGDIAGADAVRAKINEAEAQQKLSGERNILSGVRVADTLREHGVVAEGVKLPTLTPTTRPPTTATVTASQEALSTALSGIRQVQLLKPLINSGTFGPQAFLESKVIDKFLANFAPELLNKDRVKASTLVGQLRGATARAIRSDSNITKDEQEDIVSRIPDTNKFFTSPAEAVVQLETINQGIVDRAIRASRVLKQPISDELAPHVPPDLLQPLLREGLLTPEQAREWYKQRQVR